MAEAGIPLLTTPDWTRQIVNPGSSLDDVETWDEGHCERVHQAMLLLTMRDNDAAQLLTHRYRDQWSIDDRGEPLRRARKKLRFLLQ